MDTIIKVSAIYPHDIKLSKEICWGDYVILGDMSGDGSYTIFTLKGDFDPTGMQNVKTSFNITVGDAGTISIPYALVSSGSTSMQTGSSYITADFNFTAIGNGQQGPILMN